jgi:signal peptidase II
MGSLALLAVLVLLADQGVKWALRMRLGGRRISLGRLGSVRLVSARIWLARAGARRPWMVVTVWLVASIALVAVAGHLPSATLWLAALVGGSASHTIETLWRGSISDYICLRFWPAFNLADVAIAVGAVGVIMTVAAQAAS